MKNKCEKYESLFVFADDDYFQKHIESCHDCEAEHKKMQKLSYIIQEVRPYYNKKHKNQKLLKVACSMLLLLFLGSGIGLVSFDNDISDTLKYGTTLSAEDLGFPVDSYGLIMVE